MNLQFHNNCLFSIAIFDNVMTQFLINKKKKETDVNLLIGLLLKLITERGWY